MNDVSLREIRLERVGKFFMMNELFETVRSRVTSALTPGANLNVDEQLYAYRGKCNFRQYMKSKPNKYGIKYWAIGCVDSGYLGLCDFQVYLGKSKDKQKRTDKVGKKVIYLFFIFNYSASFKFLSNSTNDRDRTVFVAHRSS